MAGDAIAELIEEKVSRDTGISVLYKQTNLVCGCRHMISEQVQFLFKNEQ